MATEQDPFDTLLSLEDRFYREGYDLGVSDGDRAGLVEGRLFGLEKGFEKYATMGRLHGRAVIWAGRMSDPVSTSSEPTVEESKAVSVGGILPVSPLEHETVAGAQALQERVVQLPVNARLDGHIRTLYALTEPNSLSTDNNEESLTEFDDRLKRAEGKTKIIEKLTGESLYEETSNNPSDQKREALPIDFTHIKGDGSIEDFSSLHARH